MYAPVYNTEYSSNYTHGPGEYVSTNAANIQNQTWNPATGTNGQMLTQSSMGPPQMAPPSYEAVYGSSNGAGQMSSRTPYEVGSVHPQHFRTMRSTQVEPMGTTLRTTFYGEENLPDSYEAVHSSEAWSYDARWQGKASGEFSKDLSPSWQEWSAISKSPPYINCSPQQNMEQYKTQIP
ncbi:unnamed protein product [Owenia fusiformis]|uniref:Uncharacterized protein n=1 Tax=Owenia fusiformis TaxID=6347 RepID=A0A8S4PEZ3_OWEFU|nr:unnamed protein product [Owenia fusiformis]